MEHQDIVFGTPYQKSSLRVLLLGSGELGKELAIEFQRLAVEVIACDAYENAPAMQVAHSFRVFDMKNPGELRKVVEELNPDFIVPEVEAISTTELVALEAQGFNVIPTARATQLTMDREGIRTLAANELNLPTAEYSFANNFEEFKQACRLFQHACVVKPLMSSSGKGQSVVKNETDVTSAWDAAQTGGRNGAGRVIVEQLIDFASEITLLTIRSRSGTGFCDPIGHLQQGGDYVESWQPHFLTEEQLRVSQEIALKVTNNLGGFGIFGVELFLLKDGRVLFSEVSPRPHDTGMVTMVTQRLSQFALHARAILGMSLQFPVRRFSDGASAALRASDEIKNPCYLGLENAEISPDVQIRIFGKPFAKRNRRMGVVLAGATTVEKSLDDVRSAKKGIVIKDFSQKKTLN